VLPLAGNPDVVPERETASIDGDAALAEVLLPLSEVLPHPLGDAFGFRTVKAKLPRSER
jgi:hypothetical protein